MLDLVDECDDGNLVDGDGCSATCIIEAGFTCIKIGVGSTCFETCGDGVDLGLGTHECDDGNLANGDGCSSTCRIEDPGQLTWDCGGPPVSQNPTICTDPCGNGKLLNQAHECDDGNLVGGDGCSPTCLIEAGFHCTMPHEQPWTRCYPTCGDGINAEAEISGGTTTGTFCDDNNQWLYHDGCDRFCE